MKVKLSEQDLTDYALDELGPEERIYVEAALAGSEEAREDVYQIIDLVMMLDEGFEKQEEREPALLTLAQRQELMGLRGPNIFLRNGIAALATAACVAFAFVSREAWMPRLHLPGGATVTAAAGKPGKTGMQASAGDQMPDFISQILQVRQLREDPLLRKWFTTIPGAASPAPGMNFEAAPRASFDSLMP